MVVVLLLLAPMFSPAAAVQASNSPSITLTSQYILNGFGFVIVNETLTFSNNGTSSVQVPTVQLGLPDSIVAHSPGFVLSSNDKYSRTSSDDGAVTTFTISSGSPTLAAGSSSTVSLKGYAGGLMNITVGKAGNFSTLILLSPSLNQVVSTLNQDIVVPAGGTITPIPVGFIAAPTAASQIYAATLSNTTPTLQTQTVKFGDTSQANWIPIELYGVTRTIVPGYNGVPQVEDRVSLRNLAGYSITSLPISTLVKGLTNVTILPSSTVPTVNPTRVTLLNNALNIASPPFSSQIKAGDNFTFTMAYPLPKSDLTTSGGTISVKIPYSLPVAAIAQNYTVRVALPNGMHSVGQSRMVVLNATSLIDGTVQLQYAINPGWGSSQVVPAAALLFAVTFIVFAFSGVQTVAKKKDEEEEDEALGERLADLIKALEEKITLFQQFQDDMAKKTQGTVSRNDFAKIKNELDALKARATGRLNAVRQVAETQRYLDLLNQLQDAEREEDRASKDLLNLYDQYHSKRMREETFRRLLPNYKKRVDVATNRLSDLLNLAQREGKQA